MFWMKNVCFSYNVRFFIHMFGCICFFWSKKPFFVKKPMCFFESKVRTATKLSEWYCYDENIVTKFKRINLPQKKSTTSFSELWYMLSTWNVTINHILVINA